MIFFLLAQAASLLGARVLLRAVRTGDGALDLLQFLLLRLLLISAAVLMAGLLGALDVLGLVAAAALVVLLATGAQRDLRRPAWPELGPWIAAAAAVVALRLLLQVWFFAPHLGDAVAYHLPKVAEWVQSGGFGREMGLHPHASFPAGFELIETWWVLFLRHDVLIEAAGLEFVALAAAAVAVLARRVGLDARGAGLAALLYVLTPGFHLSATSCLNDAPAAALVLATAALIAGRASWAAIGVAAALGVGVKATAGFALPGLLILAWLLRREERKISGAAWALAGVAAAVGIFWYARNLAWYGNPVYPLGSSIDNPVAVQLGPRWGSLGATLSDLLSERLLDGAAASGANVDHGAGWGAGALGLGLVGLVLQWRDEPRIRPLALAFLASLLTTLLFTQNDPWCLKYVFFFPALLAIAGAAWARRSRAAAGLAAAALAFSFLATLLPYDLPWSSFKELARQPVATRSALTLWADDAPADRVACRGGFEMRSYLLYRPDFSRRVIYLRGGDLERARQEGVDYLYADGDAAGRRLHRLRPGNP